MAPRNHPPKGKGIGRPPSPSQKGGSTLLSSPLLSGSGSSARRGRKPPPAAAPLLRPPPPPARLLSTRGRRKGGEAPALSSFRSGCNLRYFALRVLVGAAAGAQDVGDVWRGVWIGERFGDLVQDGFVWVRVEVGGREARFIASSACSWY